MISKIAIFSILNMDRYLCIRVQKRSFLSSSSLFEWT